MKKERFVGFINKNYLIILDYASISNSFFVQSYKHPLNQKVK